MARKKVTLERITSDAARRTTFKKRLNGLMKKAGELATLCAINVCVVVYAESQVRPTVVWPSVAEAEPILARFKAMPELDNFKKTLDQEEFLRQRIAKLKEQLRKEQRETHEHETKVLLHDAILGRLPGLVGLTIEELTSLSSMVQMRLKSIKERIEQLNGQVTMSPPPMMQVASSSLLPTSNTNGNMYVNSLFYQAPQQKNWHMGGGFSWNHIPGPSNPSV